MKRDQMHLKEYSLEGRYANYFKIGHNSDVFVIDYFQYFPAEPDKNIESKMNQYPGDRIITTPADAKQLSIDLKNALDDYEKKNGHIGE